MSRWKVAAAAAWLAVGLVPAVAQELDQLIEETQKQEEQMRRIPGTEAPGRVPEGMEGRVRLPKGEEVQRLLISQDRKIDPRTYTVGPGDVLQLHVWGEFDQDIPFQVNPEGLAIVPTVGSFRVSNRSLAAVRQEIIAAAQQEKYPGVEITLALLSMRYFTVYLTGAVLHDDGAYTVTPTTRLSDLIQLGGGFRDDFQGTQEQETRAGEKVTRLVDLVNQPTARRSIRVIHEDGSAELVDLAMFLATGDIAHNPYLRMGDVVHVGYRNQEIFAFGSVNEEGAQEFRPGDTVAHLVRLAGGISGSAPLEAAELWRFSEHSDTSVVVPLIAAGFSASGKWTTVEDIGSIPLQPKDMLFIRTRSDWQMTPTVHAHGELRYRGRYRIVQGKTRLTDFIEQAGGFTANANLVEARVLRTKYRAIQDPELARLQAVVQAGGLADLNPEERAYLRSKGREERGRLAVDFERLFAAGDQTQNILIEGGDVIYIPEKRATVSLSGQFQKPGLVTYQPGRRAGWYLDQAGGYAYNADKGGARLIRARTSQRERLNRNQLVEAGDEIWIPEKEYRDWWAFVQGTMRTTAEALTIVILLRTL
ncbi:MAG: SLBB domain-containing protein [Gemmatimonadota bacterium]